MTKTVDPYRFTGGITKKLVKSWTKLEESLLKMFDTDEGAYRLGELGIGLNYGITHFTRNIFYDRKIGATIH